MTTHADRAAEAFAKGYNCSQAVLVAFAAELNLDEATALKMAAPFGGGLARRGDACGAVTGAMMVLGLARASTDSTPQAKGPVYKLTNELFRRFNERNMSIQCRDLLGFELSTPEGMRLATERDVHHKVCPKFVRDAAEIVEQLLAE